MSVYTSDMGGIAPHSYAEETVGAAVEMLLPLTPSGWRLSAIVFSRVESVDPEHVLDHAIGKPDTVSEAQMYADLQTAMGPNASAEAQALLLMRTWANLVKQTQEHLKTCKLCLLREKKAAIAPCQTLVNLAISRDRAQEVAGY